MKTLSMEKKIHAPQEVVWEAIVDPVKYSVWTSGFAPGSTFDGDWETGSKIKFFMEDGEHNEQGMSSEIALSRWPEWISIHHLGIYANGVEDFDSEEAQRWAPAYENYGIEPLESGWSLFKLSQDIEEEMLEQFQQIWTDSLERLAALCEAAVGESMAITVRSKSKASLEKVWEALTIPEHVMGWNFAGDDWYCPKAANELKPGGEFHYEMAAKDGSFAFDFGGIYEEITPSNHLNFRLGDGRTVKITLTEKPYGTLIEETFIAENENNWPLQRQGWGMILDRLAGYAQGI